MCPESWIMFLWFSRDRRRSLSTVPRSRMKRYATGLSPVESHPVSVFLTDSTHHANANKPGKDNKTINTVPPLCKSATAKNKQVSALHVQVPSLGKTASQHSFSATNRGNSWYPQQAMTVILWSGSWEANKQGSALTRGHMQDFAQRAGPELWTSWEKDWRSLIHHFSTDRQNNQHRGDNFISQTDQTNFQCKSDFSWKGPFAFAGLFCLVTNKSVFSCVEHKQKHLACYLTRTHSTFTFILHGKIELFFCRPLSTRTTHGLFCHLISSEMKK